MHDNYFWRFAYRNTNVWANCGRFNSHTKQRKEPSFADTFILAIIITITIITIIIIQLMYNLICCKLLVTVPIPIQCRCHLGRGQI